MKRSINDLITEMETEARHANTTVAAIAVGFEHETKFVFVSNPDPANALMEYVKAGGQPIGMFMFVTEKDQLGRKNIRSGRLLVRKFREWADAGWVDGYLNSIAQSFRALCQKMPGVITPESN